MFSRTIFRFKRGDVLLLFIEFCSGAFCESGKNIFAFCFYFKVMEIVSDPRSVFDEQKNSDVMDWNCLLCLCHASEESC